MDMVNLMQKTSSLASGPGGDFGALIEARPGQHLQDVPGTEALEAVRRDGALLLRGFSGSLADFERFTQTVAARFIHNGNDDREALGDQGRTRSVTPGQNYVGPHSEFSYTPFRPDLLFFYCMRPVAEGGASLLWDGRRIWRDMPDRIKEIFLKKDIMYRYRGVGAGAFSQFVGDVSIAELCSFLDRVPGLHYTRTRDALDIDYAAKAYVNEPGTSHLSFSNSIAVVPETAFGDGSTLDAMVRGQLLALALEQTVRIDTLPGDVIAIDNWRVMHGREAFSDPQRKMCIRMGYAAPQDTTKAEPEIEEVEY